MLLALVISSRPSSCNGRASVQRHCAVPLGLNEIVVFMSVLAWLGFGLSIDVAYCGLAVRLIVLLASMRYMIGP